jgi:hypothetical protein
MPRSLSKSRRQRCAPLRFGGTRVTACPRHAPAAVPRSLCTEEYTASFAPSWRRLFDSELADKFPWE